MERRWENALDLFFGIGFKIGFLIAVIGLIMMYMPLLHKAVNPLLEYIGFWEAFRANPGWLRVFITGIVLMVAAIAVSVVKGWVEDMAEILFKEDEFFQEHPIERPQNPKSSL
jgi:hypothetical protein